jgi:hypothetical protein
MPDMTLIAGTISSLKSAFDISKLLVAVRDSTMLNEKVLELQRAILAAQSDALAAQSDQFALLERVRNLEKQLVDIKAWDSEKQRYELQAVYRDAFAYALKPDSGGSEPPHWLCNACYQNGKKSILSALSRVGRDEFWVCPTCSAKIRVEFGYSPSETWPGGPKMRSDPSLSATPWKCV